MCRSNQTLTLITLLLFTFAISISCTSNNGSSETLNPPRSSISSEGVPEWFENCVLHWVYRVRCFETLVDTQPFTAFRGHDSDEGVERCWANETLALAEAREPGPGVSPNDASPWVLEALRRLVAKGLIKPFSYFEQRARMYGVGWAVHGPPLDRYARSTWQVLDDYLLFQRSMEQGCTDAIRECDDDSYTSCDPTSLEYWCHFFDINDVNHPALSSEIYRIDGRIVRLVEGQVKLFDP